MKPPAALEAIFAAALEKRSSQERSGYLAAACQGDAELRRQVEQLLQAHEQAGSFLEQPVLAPPATCAHVPDGDALQEGAGTRIGPYKLLQQIGEGGMGTVFMAEQTEPVHRHVAVKVIKPGMDSRQILARFEAERQALAMMDHPNIAKVFEAGATASGHPYFVMELVKGIAITRYCDEHHVPLHQRLALYLSVCHAVQHAHQKGIIHRDLKPSNVLVALYDDQAVVKVIDFGVAKAMSQRLTERTMFTEFGALVGTLEYMSPEQAKLNALDIDTRSDVYALGVLLYELLTGTTPLPREQIKQTALEEVLRLIREEEPPAPSTRLSASGTTLPALARKRGAEPLKLKKLLQGELDWIVLKALEKDRTRRYDTASALARDLDRYLKDEPVEACPPSLTYRLKKTLRKHRKGFTMATALILLLLAGVFGSTWQAMRALEAEGHALDAEKQAKQDRRETLQANQQLRDAEQVLHETLYATRANLIQVAWDTHNIQEVERLLEEQRPKKGDKDLRGFEWHYWKRLLRLPLRSIAMPQLHEYQLSADGTRLVGFGSKDRLTRLQQWARTYDASNGTQVSDITLEPAVEVTIYDEHSYFSADARLVGAGDAIRDTTTDKIVAKVPGRILALTARGDKVAFVPADKLGVALGPNPFGVEHIKLWEIASKKELCALTVGVGAPVRVVFAPQGDYLACAMLTAPTTTSLVSPARVVVHNLSTREKVLDIPNLVGHVQLAFSPDGKRLAVANRASAQQGDARGELKIWHLGTGKELLYLTDLADLTQGGGLVFSPDGSQIVVGSYSFGAVQVRNAATGHLQCCLAGQRFSKSLAFLGKDSHLVVFDGDMQLQHYDVTPPAQSRFNLGSTKHEEALQAEFLHMSTFPRPFSWLEMNPTARSLAYFAGADCILANWRGQELKRYRLDVPEHHGQLQAPMPGQQLAPYYTGLAVSEDGNHLALHTNTEHRGSWRTRLQVYQLRPEKLLLDAEEKRTLDPQKEADSVFMTLSPDGTALARYAHPFASLAKENLSTYESPYKISVWTLHGDRNEWPLDFPDHQVKHVAFAPKDGLMATLGVSQDQKRMEVILWDRARQSKLRTLPLPIPRFHHPVMIFSPKGDHLALSVLGEKAEHLFAWECATGKMLFAKNLSYQFINSLAFSPDGRRLLTAAGTEMGDSGSITIYDQTGRRLASWKAHGGGIRRVHFSPDGHQLYTVGYRVVRPGDAVKEWDGTPLPE